MVYLPARETGTIFSFPGADKRKRCPAASRTFELGNASSKRIPLLRPCLVFPSIVPMAPSWHTPRKNRPTPNRTPYLYLGLGWSPSHAFYPTRRGDNYNYEKALSAQNPDAVERSSQTLNPIRRSQRAQLFPVNARPSARFFRFVWVNHGHGALGEEPTEKGRFRKSL